MLAILVGAKPRALPFPRRWSVLRGETHRGGIRTFASGGRRPQRQGFVGWVIVKQIVNVNDSVHPA